MRFVNTEMKTPKKQTEFNIVSNIPIPKPARDYWPFKSMKVGDSFYFEGKRANLSTNASTYAKRHGGKFRTRSEGKGFRCWRIE